MKRFEDLHVVIPEKEDMFVCKKNSVLSVLNREITILGIAKNVKTQYGENRMVVHYSVGDKDAKFVTNAETIKEVLLNVRKEDFPFTTTISCKQDTDGKRYYEFR
jgi:hypothetical protein